jgi:hypothetical protein
MGYGSARRRDWRDGVRAASVSVTSTSRILDEARGHEPGDGHGTDGNERLTALTGTLLFVLLAAEGFTILALHNLLTAHVFIGVLLIPPILLKLGSTGYRFTRYYRRDPAYRSAGPPVTPMRLLAPFLVLLTLVVFASGVALVITGTRNGNPLLFIHKASFILWLVVAAIHILYYLVRIPRILGSEVGAAGRRRRGVANRGLRFAALAGALVVGIGLGFAFIPLAHTWEHKNPQGHSGRAGTVRVARAGTVVSRDPARG